MTKTQAMLREGAQAIIPMSNDVYINVEYSKLIISRGKLSFSSCGAARASDSEKYIDWEKYKGLVVNLGGWFEQEAFIDVNWWNSMALNTTDEWTLCQTLGARCSPELEHWYSTWVTHADIDKLARIGVSQLI
jgi:hypothetical protein